METDKINHRPAIPGPRTRHSTAACYRGLAAAIVGRAIDDLKGTDPFLSSGGLDRAMTFVAGETCAAYCSFVGIDHEAVRKKAAALYRRIVEKGSAENSIELHIWFNANNL